MLGEKKPKRKSLTRALERRIILEAKGECPWCQKPVIAAEVEIHHIDSDRSNNSPENLILTCRNHHGQITAQVIPDWEVKLKKQILCNPATMERLGLAPSVKQTAESNPIVNGVNNGVAAKRIDKVVINNKSPKGRRSNTPGLVESDPDMRTYANYLVAKYIEWRLNGKSIDKRKFSPASAHGILGEGFGCGNSVYLIAQLRFFEWVKQAQRKIDGTVFGKRNRNAGIRNYHSWDEHLKERGRQ